MQLTNIPWVFNPDGSRPGYSLNIITGCENHVDGMCLGGDFPCYAYKLANGRVKNHYLNGDYLLPPTSYPCGLNDPFYPRFWPDRLQELVKRNHAKHIKDQRGIFVCDMSDLFGIGVPGDWTVRVLDAIRQNVIYPGDRFYILTKQYYTMTKYSSFPENCVVGMTATKLKYLKLALEHMKNIQAKVKFLSLEPLLEDMSDWTPGGFSQSAFAEALNDSGVNWVITGCQTKPLKLPPSALHATLGSVPIALKHVLASCSQAGVPVLVKPPLSKMLVGFRLEETPWQK